MALRFGLGFFTGQVPVGGEVTHADEYEATIRLAELAEALGFDSVWVSEHHGAADGYLPSLNVLLAALAARTSRVELAMGVALAPFQEPLRFAEDCAVVDLLSRGRLVVGLGAGWREEEFRAFGVPLSERVRRTVELVEVCRRAWTEPRFSYAGPVHRYDQVAVTPKPLRVPPIVMGGFAEAAVRRAGRLADGYIASRPDMDSFRRSAELVSAAAAEAGRDPQRLRLAVNLYAHVSPDGVLPEAVARAVWVAQGTYAGWADTDRPGVPFRLPPFSAEAVSQVLVHGTPDQLVRHLRPWAEAFGDRDFEVVVRFHFPGMTYAESAAPLELFASEVIPALKA